MRISFLLLALAGIVLPSYARAQTDGGGDPSAAPAASASALYRPPLPRVDSIPSDWESEFKSDSARRDFKRLREYRAGKQALLDQARPQVDVLRSLRDELDARRAHSAAVSRELSEVMAGVRQESGMVTVPSRSFEFDRAVGHATPGEVPVRALRDLQSRLIAQDSLDRLDAVRIDALQERLASNIANLESDRRQVEAAIDSALTPEYQNQRFRLLASGFFSVLIAVVILAFFGTIYRKARGDISKTLLSEAGLQFVTIFVLIIALVLFGILNILEGRELAAILSGIAGYILGRGARLPTGKPEEERDAAAPPPPPPPTGAASADAGTPPSVSVPRVFTEPSPAGTGAAGEGMLDGKDRSAG